MTSTSSTFGHWQIERSSREAPEPASSSNSVLVADDLLDGCLGQLSTHYRDTLAFDWRQRSRRVESAVYTFAQLRESDRRMEACISGMAFLKERGTAPPFEALHEAVSEAELFALTCQAATGRRREVLEACIGLVQALSTFRSAFSSALEWLDWPCAEIALAAWPGDDPFRQALALQVIANHGLRAPPGEVARSLSRLAPILAVQLSVLNCALHTGDADWALHAPDWIGSEDPEVRLAAAEALIVFAEEPLRRSALLVLRDLAFGTSRVASVATRDLMTLGGKEAHELMEALSTSPNRRRQFVTALGWGGRLKDLPVLVNLFDDPTLARLAGAAVAALTGSGAVADGWAAEPPHQSPEVSRSQGNGGTLPDFESDHLPKVDPDADLPWPVRALFEREQVAARMPITAERVIAGQVCTTDHLMSLLRTGQLASRPQAAWLLQVASRERRFPHLAPASRQQALLNHMHDGARNG